MIVRVDVYGGHTGGRIACGFDAFGYPANSRTPKVPA